MLLVIHLDYKVSPEGDSSVAVNPHTCMKNAHKADVNSVSWLPKVWEMNQLNRVPNYLLASGGDDREINLWSVPLNPFTFQEDILALESDEYIEDVD